MECWNKYFEEKHFKCFFFLHSDTQPPTKPDEFTLPPTVYGYTQIFVNWNILNNGILIWIYSHSLVIYILYFNYLFMILAYFSLFNHFYWSIVNLQCCINFRCTVKWFHYTHIHIYVFLFRFFHYKILNIVPCAISRSLLLIYFIHSSACILIPNS